MKRTTGVMLGIGALATVAMLWATESKAIAGRGNGGVIYVVSQGLYYDTFGAADPLPMQGRFQMLNPNHPNGPATMYGPGDQGYVGGRWWVDENGNGEMDEGDHFFLCPLLGPGREEP